MVDRLPTKVTCEVNSSPMNQADRVTRRAFVGGVAGLPTASGLNDCSVARNRPAASKFLTMQSRRAHALRIRLWH